MVEGETKIVTIGGMQRGNYVIVEGIACKVTDIQISRPGKHGHAKVRMTAVGIIDGKKRVFMAPGHDNIETPIIGKKTAQVLSVHGDRANVMDAETYETFDLKIEPELKADCKEGCNVLYWTILSDKVMKQVKQE